MADNDTLDVFILKAPVWEFLTGDLLGYFVSPHQSAASGQPLPLVTVEMYHNQL